MSFWDKGTIVLAAWSLVGVRKTAEESIAQVTAANIARFKSGTAKSANRSSLSELLVSFFAKVIDFSHIVAIKFPLKYS